MVGMVEGNEVKTEFMRLKVMTLRLDSIKVPWIEGVYYIVGKLSFFADGRNCSNFYIYDGFYIESLFSLVRVSVT